MRILIILQLLLIFTGCLVSEQNITGTYRSQQGDTLKILDNHSFRAELNDPDTIELKQVKYCSGRWNLEKGKLYLTCATRDMGGYWGCMPLNAGPSHLSRPIDCNKEKNDGSLSFQKLMLPGKMKVKKAARRASRGEVARN